MALNLSSTVGISCSELICGFNFSFCFVEQLLCFSDWGINLGVSSSFIAQKLNNYHCIIFQLFCFHNSQLIQKCLKFSRSQHKVLSSRFYFLFCFVLTSLMLLRLRHKYLLGIRWVFRLNFFTFTRLRNFVIEGVACQPSSLRRLQVTPPLQTSLHTAP